MSAPQSANEPETGSLARTISRNVAALMDERRVSQAQLADAVGLQQSSLSKRLRNATHWTADDLEAVALAFDVPVVRLIEPTPETLARPLRSVAHAGRRGGRTTPSRQPAAGSRTTSEFGCTRGRRAHRARHGVTPRVRPAGRPRRPAGPPRGHHRSRPSLVHRTHRAVDTA